MFSRMAHPQRARLHPNLGFVAAFLLLNLLLFLPTYLFNRETSSFLPASSLFADGMVLGFNRLLLWRNNLDPFRLSLELTVLTALWANVRYLRRPLWRALITAIYLLALCYAVYEALIISIYLAD